MHELSLYLDMLFFWDINNLMVLDTGLVQCHFDCGCCLWMNDLSRTWMIKLQKSQNKLIRLVLGLHCFSHVNNIHFQQFGWLPIERRLVLQKVRLVQKIINDRAPVYFNSYFSQVNVRHGSLQSTDPVRIQMVVQHLDTTSTALNISGDQDT